MIANYINRIRSGFIAAAIAALLFALPSGLFAQNSPLTVVPSTGKVGVGVGATNPQSTLDVSGTVNVTGTVNVGSTVTATGFIGNGSQLTNLPASGPLNVKIWLPAAGCNNAAAGTVWDLPTSNAASAACVTGTNTQKGVLDFPDTAGGFSAQITQALPADWSSTPGLDIALYWTTTATTGNAKWSVSTACTSVNASALDDPTFNAANTVITAAPGTANAVQTSTIAGLTLTGCTGAQATLLHIKVFRDGNDAADTISATARLIGAELVYRRPM
jgi:hypothetical protein